MCAASAMRTTWLTRARSPPRTRPLREALRQRPPPAGAYGRSRAPVPSRTAAKRRSLATPTRASPFPRLRPCCELLAGVSLGRRAPSGESLGSLDAWLALRSRRVVAAVTIDCRSSARPGSSWMVDSSRSPDSRDLSSGAAGRYQPRFRLLSGRSALLDGSAEARSDVPSPSVRRPPRSRRRAPLRPSPVLLPFPSGDPI